jgi:hypothetical protein
MRFGGILGAALLLALAGMPAAAAGCPLVADPAGDVVAPGLPVTSPDVDIRGVDLASGRKTVVVVLRVESLTAGPATPGDVEWRVEWWLGTRPYRVGVRRDRTGRYAPANTPAFTWPVPVMPVVDAAAGTFTWTFGRGWLRELAAAGAVFDRVWAGTGALVRSAATPYNDPAFSARLDDTDAARDRSYRDRAPGCVRAA